MFQKMETCSIKSAVWAGEGGYLMKAAGTQKAPLVLLEEVWVYAEPVPGTGAPSAFTLLLKSFLIHVIVCCHD